MENKLFTKKKDLKTNPKDALIAEEPERHREETIASQAGIGTPTIGGKKRRVQNSPF